MSETVAFLYTSPYEHVQYVRGSEVKYFHVQKVFRKKIFVIISVVKN